MTEGRSTTVDEYLAEHAGQMHVVLTVCSLLVALHPRREEFKQAIAGLAKSVVAEDGDPPGKRAHARGIATAVGYFQSALATAERSAKSRSPA